MRGHHAARRRNRAQGLPRRRGEDRAGALPRRARPFSPGRRDRPARHGRLHAGGAAVCRDRRRGRRGHAVRQYPRDRRLVGRRRGRRPEDGGADRDSGGAAPGDPVSCAQQRGRDPGVRPRQRAIEAKLLGTARRDGAAHPATSRAGAGHPFRRARHDPLATGHLGVRAHGRRLHDAGALLARRARVRPARQHNVAPDIVLRRRRRRCFRARPARRLPARRSGRSAACCAPCSGARPGQHVPTKPRYVTFTEHLCRVASRIVAATAASISARPARSRRRAITSRSTPRCAGCGQCAAVCPTGAASYALRRPTR